MREVAFLADILSEVHAAHPGLEPSRLVHELVRRVITRCVEDAIAESLKRIAAVDATSVDAIRQADAPVVAFSEAMQRTVREIKAFLFAHMYRAPEVTPARDAAMRVVAQLFAKLQSEPDLMPKEWMSLAGAAPTEAKRARVVADYIAGMTDRYALMLYRRFFDDPVQLR